MKRILVVSANRDETPHLLSKLRRFNLDYHIVTSGKACLEILEDNEICVAVIDNRILDIQGHKLLDLLINLKPEIKVIFINDTHDPEIESRVRQLGVVYYASNLRDGKIVRIVSQLIKRKQSSNLTSSTLNEGNHEQST